MKGSKSQDGVQHWSLGIRTPVSLKGCDTSLDGSIIYWSDSWLFLFTSASTVDVKKSVLQPIGKYKLEDGNGFWTAAKISRRYVVATTTGGDSSKVSNYFFMMRDLIWLTLAYLHCLVFHLPNTGRSSCDSQFRRNP